MNNSNGQDKVVSSAVFALHSFIAELKKEIPNINLVYDEELSYDSAVSRYREANNLEGDRSQFFPLMAYNRSIMRYSELAGPGRRMSSLSAIHRAGNDTSGLYKVVHGEIDIRFLYIVKDIKQFEEFEILYLSGEGISSKRKVLVDLSSDLGEGFQMEYNCIFGDLEDKTFNYQGSYYKGIFGTVVLRGFYPVLRLSSKHILSISAKYKTLLGNNSVGEILEEKLIVP